MDKSKQAFILKHHKTDSTRNIAQALNLSRQSVEKEISRLRAGTPASAPAGLDAIKPVRRHHLIAAAFLILITSAVYAKSVSFPFINWDDPSYVSENADIRSFSGENLKKMFTKTYAGLYVPLSMLSFALDYQIYHMDARGYHFTNVCVHLVNVLLIYSLIFLITREWAVALAASLVFAVHPVQPESVVWISQRKNVLSYSFFLVSFLCYVLYRVRDKRRGLYLFGSVAAFVISFFAKPLAFVLPGILLAFDYCAGHLQFNKKTLLRHAPFALLAVLFIAITLFVFATVIEGKYHGGSPWFHFLTMTVVLMKYVQLCFFPMNQSILYSFPVYRSVFEAPVMLSMLALAFIAAGLYFFWKRDRALFFWALWVLVLIFPVLNIIPQLVLLQDRWLYLPVAGVYVILFSLLRRRLGTLAVFAAAGILTLGFSVLNLKRQDAWASPQALWLETQKVARGGSIAPYLNLANHYVRQGNLDAAISEYEKALKVSPEQAEIFNGLGTVYAQQGKLHEAALFLGKAISLRPSEPSAYNQLGFAYKRMGKNDLALAQYEKAVELDRNQDPEYYNNLGIMLAVMGRDDAAGDAFKNSLKIDPDFADTMINYGNYLFQRGRFDEASEILHRFLKLYPKSLHRPAVESLLASVDKIKSSFAET